VLPLELVDTCAPGIMCLTSLHSYFANATSWLLDSWL